RAGLRETSHRCGEGRPGGRLSSEARPGASRRADRDTEERQRARERLSCPYSRATAELCPSLHEREAVKDPRRSHREEHSQDPCRQGHERSLTGRLSALTTLRGGRRFRLRVPGCPKPFGHHVEL